MQTATTFPKVKYSTPAMTPMRRVKKPLSRRMSTSSSERYLRSLLVLQRIVLLPTVVYSRLALTVQFPMNQIKQSWRAR